MNSILVIHASPRGARSHSRRLAESFVARRLALDPTTQVHRREVGRALVEPVNEAWIAAAFAKEVPRPAHMEADLATSDALIDELQQHALLVISLPMYNFSVPAGLKAWVDQVIRLGRTVAAEATPEGTVYRPLVHGKRAVIVTTRGGEGFGPGGPYAHLNHADTWLRAALEFIGITDVQVIAAESDETERFAQTYREAEDALARVADQPSFSQSQGINPRTSPS
jgi:FMN-dependent NADH-azoreductase